MSKRYANTLRLGASRRESMGLLLPGITSGIPPCQAVWRYDAVFTKTVEDITDPGLPIAPLGASAVSPLAFPQRKVRIRIIEALRGIDPDQREIVIETGRGGGDCGYPFQRGLDYIVYASKKPSGSLSTAIGSPTRLADKAAESLKYFHELAYASPLPKFALPYMTFTESGKPGRAVH